MARTSKRSRNTIAKKSTIAQQTLCNSTYLFWISLFCDIKSIVTLVALSKFHKNVYYTSNNKLIKAIVRHDFGDIVDKLKDWDFKKITQSYHNFSFLVKLLDKDAEANEKTIELKYLFRMKKFNAAKIWIRRWIRIMFPMPRRIRKTVIPASMKRSSRIIPRFKTNPLKSELDRFTQITKFKTKTNMSYILYSPFQSKR